MKLPRWTGLLLLVAAVGVGAGLAYEGLKPEPAPRVDYVLLDGSKHTSAQAWTGKVMLVNFWATSCTTCVKEMPNVVATHQKYKDKGFDTLAVAMSYDPPAYVANYAETRALPFGVAMDSTGEIARSFGKVQLTPTTFLINKRGEIVKRFVGEPDFAALHGTIEKLLAEG
ncbi:TlpA disulfide reductase family protein [Mitsuaria sp. GD03876]|uniref:TlpA disulfide reductase family protein n=1 Tax=Mitsuaria sp. GD03876 TaxID=2975399 RepID=UPI0024476FA1|nr:TlpA disulfide reductase family protein [Mitsuaria sp. GD03876]MDH0868376.1 TlpA family protein disulfide reductase [Mitsuaria sp. GD03876]